MDNLCPCCLSVRIQSHKLPSGHLSLACSDCQFIWVLDDQNKTDLYNSAYTPEEQGFVYKSVNTYQALKEGRPVCNNWYEDDFISYVRPFGQKRLLEIGCSTGRFLLACRSAGWNVAGLDISGKAVQLARDLLPERRFHVGTIEQSGFAASSFDAVASWEVIEHVDNPFAFVTAISNILPTGGKLTLSTPDWGSWAVRRHPKKNYWPPYHICFFTQASISALLERAGFTVLRIKRKPIPWSETCWPKWKRFLMLPFLAWKGIILRQGGGRLVVYAQKRSI